MVHLLTVKLKIRQIQDRELSVPEADMLEMVLRWVVRYILREM